MLGSVPRRTGFGEIGFVWYFDFRRFGMGLRLEDGGGWVRGIHGLLGGKSRRSQNRDPRYGSSEILTGVVYFRAVYFVSGHSGAGYSGAGYSGAGHSYPAYRGWVGLAGAGRWMLL